MKIDHIPDLSRYIKRVINQSETQTFPVVVEFNESMELPQFRVTIEKLEVDTYIDASGQKWKKVT